MVDSIEGGDPFAFVVPTHEQVFMVGPHENRLGLCNEPMAYGLWPMAYGALATCCTSALVGEDTLHKLLLPRGLEFVPTGEVKVFRGIGVDLVQSKQ